MAKVKNQDLPTDYFEETLDPPIPFVDMYEKVLSQGIDWPKLPAGEEIVTYAKLDSRPSMRTGAAMGPSPKQKDQRAVWSRCATCWEKQYLFDYQTNDCNSYGSRHWWLDWKWIAGAKNTFYNVFMQQCVDYLLANPNKEFPKCMNILPTPGVETYCPGDHFIFELLNATFPVTVWADCGIAGPALEWTAPSSFDECPSEAKVYFLDSEARRGCAYFTKKPIEECCCPQDLPLEISYTSLMMSCGEQQELKVDPDFPGCPPYVFSLSGGGALIQTGLDSALYTAPSTNPNCENNPTITLTDICGKVATLKLAINCYPWSGVAYMVYDWVLFNTWPHCGTYSQGPPLYEYYIYADRYRCDGEFIDRIYSPPTEECIQYPPTSPMCCYTGITGPPGDCGLECIGEKFNFYYDRSHGSAVDLRTNYQKESGCCPINPATGLPF